MKKIIMAIVFLTSVPIFAQETNSTSTTTTNSATTNSSTAESISTNSVDKLSLKLRGVGISGGIAIIISNRSPVFNEVRSVTAQLLKDNYRIAMVPEDYDYDVKSLTQKTSPFDPDIKYVIKIHVFTKSISEQLIKTKIEMIRLSDAKYISDDYTVARANVKFFAGHLKRMLTNLIPQDNIVNPKITNVVNNQFMFLSKEFPALRRGDEIKLRYESSREGRTESVAFVKKFSNDFVIAQDISKKVKDGDVVVRNSPKRNRFYFNIGGIVPTLGESTLIAKSGNKIWKDSPRWPGGFKVEGEFERFLPHQLVSTTAFGINVDRTLHTYLMTGIGYRVFLNSSWEMTPYFRLGVSYNPLGLRAVSGTGDHLQGFSLNIGMALGANFIRRVGESMFIGADLGAQYYPVSLVNVLSGSGKESPQWQQDGQFTDKFSATKLYPYLSIKIGWVF